MQFHFFSQGDVASLKFHLLLRGHLAHQYQYQYNFLNIIIKDVSYDML